MLSTNFRGRFVEKNSCLTPPLGVTKFIIVTDMILVTLVLLKRHLDDKNGVTEFTNIRDMILVIVCCVA
jgi:hypothetical protein